MDFFFRLGTDVYGNRILLGANWDAFWWMIAAGALAIAVHAVSVPLIERRRAKLEQRQSGR